MENEVQNEQAEPETENTLDPEDIAEITAPFHKTVDRLALAMSVAMLATCLASGAAIYFAKHVPEPLANPTCELNNLSIQAANGAEKAKNDYAIESVKRDNNLRLKVIEACVGHGNIPIFVNGNVDCKREPK